MCTSKAGGAKYFEINILDMRRIEKNVSNILKQH